MRLVLAVVLILTCAAASMAYNLRSGQVITIDEGVTVDDDMFAAGNSIDISGRINGTVYAAGNSIEITGPITGTLTAAGNSVMVSGSKGTLTLAGSNIRLRRVTARNAALAGANLIVDNRTRIEKDLLASGSNIMLLGTTGRNIMAAGSSVTIGGNTRGNVQVESPNITILPSAVIQGNLIYRGPNEPKIASGAQIRGRTIRQSERPAGGKREDIGGRIILWVIRFIAMLVFGLLLVALFPGWSVTSAQRAIASPGWSALWGLVVLIAAPIGILIAFITIIGIPVAVTAFFGYVIALMVAVIVIALAAGLLLLRGRAVWLQLIVGLVIVYLLSAIPIVGWLIKLAVLIIGLGALALVFVRPRRAAEQQPPVL